MPYVRESWFEGETFVDLDDARRSAETWCRDVAGLRVHGTTRQLPRERFETIEKPAMLPPPAEPFDVPLWVDEAKVHPDHHIQVARALYSVPSSSGAKVVRARADKSTVKIYAGTLLIKMHARQVAGGRSTDPSDYPTGKADYALRSVDALIARAKDKGHHIGIYAERLLGGPLPWARMRAAYALLRLCDKFSELSFEERDCEVGEARLRLLLRGQSAPDSGALVLEPLVRGRFVRVGQHSLDLPLPARRRVGDAGSYEVTSFLLLPDAGNRRRLDPHLEPLDPLLLLLHQRLQRVGALPDDPQRS